MFPLLDIDMAQMIQHQMRMNFLKDLGKRGAQHAIMSPRKWAYKGRTEEPRKFITIDRDNRNRKLVLDKRTVHVYTYDETSRYDGAALRKIRARNGVGRPPIRNLQ